jgi:inosine-uridine nucleoside N-ribohydrolase
MQLFLARRFSAVASQLWLLVLGLLIATSSLLPAAAAVPVIFDTDMGNDVDDALALAMLHALEDRGECRLLGITLTNANPKAAPYLRMVNRFYGRPAIPIGAAVRSIANGDKDGFLSAALQGAPPALLAVDGPAQKATEPAVRLLRRLLAGSPEPVVIIQVGFSTNLAALLDSPADEVSPLTGLELVRRKVSLVSAMAGNFVEPTPEYNVKLDIPAAQKLAEASPAPIVFSGFEIGRALKYPAASIEKDYRYAAWHPIEASYRAYNKMPYDRPTWDLTSVLYAVRPTHGYFTLSDNGHVSVDAATGRTTFTPMVAGSGKHRYLRLDSAGQARVLEALTLLSSQPPSGAKSAK